MAIHRQQIIQEAIRLLDELGIEGVTMRKLAQALEIQAPSLYWHFSNKQALIDGLADALFENVARDISPELGWEEVLYRVAGEIRQALRAHRDGARVFAGTYVVTDNVLRTGEAMIRATMLAGASCELAAHASFSILYYVLGFVMEEQALGPESKLDTDSLRDAFVKLTANRYPYSYAAGGALFDVDLDKRYMAGLNLLIEGLKVRLQDAR